MTTDRIESISLHPDHLRDSPTNPRQTYSDASLQELANSIASQGILQPIRVRRTTPEGFPAQHELVFGHRRVRAARLAGLEFGPAIVCDMTDEQVAAAQIHENLQREDVSPLEEAEGFDRLIRKFGVPIEQVVADSGKSRAYVYGRLKLRKLFKPGQDAIATGLATDAAQVIASLPTEALQRKALDDVRDNEWVDGKYVRTGWRSVRDAKRILAAGKYFIAFAKAPFLPDDATLGGEPCTACPSRTINDPSAEPGSDLCTDVACFEGKTRALHAQAAARLREQGHTVLEGEQAALFQPHRYSAPAGFTSLTTGYWIDGDNILLQDLLANRPEHLAEPKLTYVVDDEDGSLRGYMANADRAALVKAAEHAAGQDSDGDDDDSQGGGASEAGGDDDGDDDEGSLSTPLPPTELAVRNDWPNIQRATMRAAASQQRTTADLRFVAASILDACSDVHEEIAALMGWATDPEFQACDRYGDDTGYAIDKLASMSADQVALLLVLLAIDHGGAGHGGQLFANRLALATAYGVDPLNLPADEPTASDDAEQLQLAGLPAEPASQAAAPATAATSPPARGSKVPPARYRNPTTGETWSGRGLQPKWLKAAIAAGNKLADYAVQQVAA